ncbi:MAG: 7,8-didemethyl-8-hydroxy-5-deazariboflavin synthase CofG, partial [Azonexus sp.]|nr:7,8-didemethyl-8-hydroxy-5-deazariboflavin synthase CofG [Azonexus sp.]
MNLLFDSLLGADRPDAQGALALADCDKFDALLARAAEIRDRGHGSIVTYSPKVFIPLTQLCRNVCHYCTFAKTPGKETPLYMTPGEILEIARAGARAGCHEALFTLGDKPELRYPAARAALRALGHETTISYLAEMAGLVQRETGLLPHINAGVMSADDLRLLRPLSVSPGLMLEATAPRLGAPGGPHHGSPDKEPAARLAMIAAAGELKIPFTSGILIGLGETRRERIESLLALRDLDDRYGHLQEIIIQNFRRKPGTKMAQAAEPSLEDLCWTIAVARIIFGAEANIQAPPNLSPGATGELIRAGINDLGGISPVTVDHVNPEAPWPHVRQLERETENAGKSLLPRLPVYPRLLAAKLGEWVAPELQQAVRDR